MIREFVRLHIETRSTAMPTLTVLHEDWQEALKAAREGRIFHLTGLAGGYYPRPISPAHSVNDVSPQPCTLKITGIDVEGPAECRAYCAQWGDVCLSQMPEALDKRWGSTLPPWTERLRQAAEFTALGG